MITAMVDEGAQLRELVRTFLTGNAPLATTRQLAQAGQPWDAAVWERLCKELGLAGLHLPEEHGGLGMPYDAVTVVLEELGRVLYGGPYFSTVCLGADAIALAGSDEDRARYLPAIAAGETTATLAFAEGDRYDVPEVATTASDGAAGFRLRGTKTRVVDGDTARLLVVLAREPGTDGLSLFVVDGDADGVVREALPTLDTTRRLARVTLRDAPVRLLGAAGAAGPTLRRVLARAAVSLAAEQLGGAQACLDMAVGYARIRTQFDRPIGSFQAVKHRCADMLVAVESARCAVYAAAAEADSTGPLLAPRSSAARAHCSEIFSQVATDNVHVHGGIGFTWEHDAHLYLKRAKSSEVLLGTPREHRELVARALEL
jgi:alkylation response protein AidB-like acyl-CoA dehydrogenase